MNLNVNFRRVRQENFTDPKRENFNSALSEANGKTFQNSPIHLMFYEKNILLDKLVPDEMDNEDVQLSSMSWCRLRPDYASKFQEIAQNQEIKLVEKNACS